MEKEIPELTLLKWCQLTAVFTATATPSSVSGPTHILSLCTQISSHSSSAFTELKPHPNGLHLLTRKLDAQQPRLDLRLPPSVGCAHQDCHLSKHQWNSGTLLLGAIPVCMPLQQPASSCLRQLQGQEPPGVLRGLHLPPSGTGGEKYMETTGSVPTLKVSLVHCVTGEGHYALLHCHFLIFKTRRATCISN